MVNNNPDEDTFELEEFMKETENLMYLPIEMDDGVSIFFSGYGCYHRQHKTDDGVFSNIASYQNRQFYHKLRMSIIRCLTPDENIDSK